MSIGNISTQREYGNDWYSNSEVSTKYQNGPLSPQNKNRKEVTNSGNLINRQEKASSEKRKAMTLARIANKNAETRINILPEENPLNSEEYARQVNMAKLKKSTGATSPSLIIDSNSLAGGYRKMRSKSRSKSRKKMMRTRHKRKQ